MIVNYFYLSHWIIFLLFFLAFRFGSLKFGTKKTQIRLFPFFTLVFLLIYSDLNIFSYYVILVALTYIVFLNLKFFKVSFFGMIITFLYFKYNFKPNEMLYGMSFVLFFSLSTIFSLKKSEVLSAPIKFTDYLPYSFYPSTALSGPFLIIQDIQNHKLSSRVDLEKKSFLLLTWGLFVAFMSLFLNKIYIKYYATLNHTDSFTLHLAMIKNLSFLYAQFSSWSNIAIGVSGFLGFDLKLNFLIPLLSNSPSEFWRRWHISLANFFYVYVYTPILIYFNQFQFIETKIKIYLSLVITWLVIGLWHGAEFRYIFWSLAVACSIICFSVLPKNIIKKYRFIIWLIHSYFLILITTVFVEGFDFFSSFFINDNKSVSNTNFVIVIVITLSLSLFPTFGDWVLNKLNYKYKLNLFAGLFFLLLWIAIVFLIGQQGGPVYGQF